VMTFLSRPGEWQTLVSGDDLDLGRLITNVASGSRVNRCHALRVLVAPLYSTSFLLRDEHLGAFGAMVGTTPTW
jgi:hypothetical protein